MGSSSASSYSNELDVALRSVYHGSILTRSVLRTLNNHVPAETKADETSVTVCDFAVQAIITSFIRAQYADDAFLGEESADTLRSDKALAEIVWKLVLQAKEEAGARMTENGDMQHLRDTKADNLAFPASKEEMLDLIDLAGKGQITGSGRVWVVDPVDGTNAFMQGQQYAVCLCLLVDGTQQVGVIGCPNLKFDVYSPPGQTRLHEDLVDTAGCGVVLSAVKGQGTYVRSMNAERMGDARRIDLTKLPTKSLTELNFVETALGKTTLSQAEHKAVAEFLGVSQFPTVLWSQQMKYIALTLGAADVMVRMPKTKDRFTCTHDHVGGGLLFQEAGGCIRDLDGKEIDYAQGRLIRGEVNFGMIAAMPSLFDQVHRAVKEILGKRK